MGVKKVGRKRFPVMLKYLEIEEVMSLIEDRLEEGDYFGNREHYTNRLHSIYLYLQNAKRDCEEHYGQKPKR